MKNWPWGSQELNIPRDPTPVEVDVSSLHYGEELQLSRSLGEWRNMIGYKMDSAPDQDSFGEENDMVV